ncbi:MAG: trimethylamine methyltransferase family protein, partial [Desulfovibrionales bacterium]|nr:trimethylamine methyltransferase family protein [Desulfovibrionales bacterium]
MRINDDQVQDLHQCSLRILDEIGVRFANDKALATAREFGCRVEGEVVRFSPDQISQLIEKAPSQFVLQAQNPKYNAVIGGDTMEFLSGYGAPTIMDMEGKTRPAHTGDYINFLKMIEAQDHFHINGGLPVQPTDLPPD